MSVPEGRIFLINAMGELQNINHTYRQTFLSLSQQVDLTFPPLPDDGADDSFDGYDDENDGDQDQDLGQNHSQGDRGNSPDRSDAGSRGLGSVAAADTSNVVNNASSKVDGEQNVTNTAATLAGGAGGVGVEGHDGGVSGGRDPRPVSLKNAVTGSAISLPRRWEEVAPGREKSFYPNRAAVEDQFSDLNFWRQPTPLVGDHDDDDDDDDEDDHDHDHDHDDDDDHDDSDEGQDADGQKSERLSFRGGRGLSSAGVASTTAGGRGD